jgi:hypothetical protein
MRLIRTYSAAVLALGLWGQEPAKPAAPPPPRPATNLADALKVPRTRTSLPGPFPGRVVTVEDAKANADRKADAKVVKAMVERGITGLTGKPLKASFDLLFEKKDIVGIKVNPVGGGIISTHLEVVDALVDWLVASGLPRKNIVIWDRFDYMLTEAGFTRARYPGIDIVGLQTMDEKAAEGKAKDDSAWLRPDGHHVSEGNFDSNVFYWVDVEGPKDKPYLNQHVFNGKYSFFGKLLTQRLTKIINVPVFKNTGQGVSMATKNLGYGSICNTARLHKPLGLDVGTEVLAFPVMRDKVVLNVMDGLLGQWDGGPGPSAAHIWEANTLFFATDPFAMDMTGHNLLAAKRRAMGGKVNEHPSITEYLRHGERLGLGVADPARIQVVAK